jgi:hypothetical protein
MHNEIELLLSCIEHVTKLKYFFLVTSWLLGQVCTVREMLTTYRRVLMVCCGLLARPPLVLLLLKMASDKINVLCESVMQTWTVAMTIWTWRSKTDVLFPFTWSCVSLFLIFRLLCWFWASGQVKTPLMCVVSIRRRL